MRGGFLTRRSPDLDSRTGSVVGYHACRMCRQITCQTCGRPGWAGCGRHVDQVLAHVPEDQRCACGADDTAPPSGSWLSRLLGR